MSAPLPTLRSELAALLYHACGDYARGWSDYDRLVIVDSGERGYDVVLRIDGGYSHPADADSARARWQHHLDYLLGELERRET